MNRLRYSLVVVLGLLACGPAILPPPPQETGEGSTTTAESTSGSNSSGTTGTRVDVGTPPGTSSDDDPTMDGVDSADFILPTGGTCQYDPDFPGVPRCGECSVLDQDCPEGEKCSPWANDGGNAWNATKCTPVDPEPDAPGEACTVEGSGVSGVDSCELGAMCWDVDPETNEGTCVSHCSGTDAQPTCPDEGQICVVANDGVIRLCLPGCDPRNPMACSEGLGCYPIDDTFACLPFDAQVYDYDVSDGSACAFPASCEPDTVCYADEVGPLCDDPPCCASWCDTMDPDPCPTGGVCSAFYEAGTAPEGFETLGWCEPIPGG